MATVTVVNAERTLEIEAANIIDGEVNAAGHLILERHDGALLDLGAVSGVQVDPGTGYVKADVFSYVGTADPGAVPDGSVWFDPTDVAGPFASDTQKGLIEIATNDEAIAGTDALRSVTPASLAATLAGIPGNKVQILASNAITEAALPSAYPLGISQMSLTTGSGWSVNSGFGSVTTYRPETDRTVQHFFGTPGGTGTPRMWQRQYHTTNNGGGWTQWTWIQGMIPLAAGSFTQSTAFSSYPTGWSRIYYTSANSSSWDFTGNAGEVLTFTDTDFARQTFTTHSSGSGTPQTWVRTANTANGWTGWQVLLNTPGAWTAYTPVWSSSGTAPSVGANGTLIGRYCKKGREVTCHINLTCGSNTTYGTGNYSFSLPFAAANVGASYVGHAHLLGTDRWAGQMVVSPSATTTSPFFPISSTNTRIDFQTPTRPEAFATGSQLRMTLTYESAT